MVAQPISFQKKKQNGIATDPNLLAREPNEAKFSKLGNQELRSLKSKFSQSCIRSSVSGLQLLPGNKHHLHVIVSFHFLHKFKEIGPLSGAKYAAFSVKMAHQR